MNKTERGSSEIVLSERELFMTEGEREILARGAIDMLRAARKHLFAVSNSGNLEQVFATNRASQILLAAIYRLKLED